MLNRTTFGILPDGTRIDILTLGSPAGLQMKVLTYGCIIQSLAVPSDDGHAVNVVLGFDRLEPYVNDSPYFGAVVGRYANRIANAQFAIDGREYRVTPNEPPNHLHGGLKGFDKRVWDAEASGNGTSVVCRRRSPDGEEGYPGTLDVQVTYTLVERELRVRYEAISDAATHVNLTQHSYFNLRGSGDVLDHRLAIHASTYLPVDERLIPTGELAPVVDTPFDFQQPTPIGSRIRTEHVQLTRGGGYDHNFNLNGTSEAFALAARVLEPSSHRTLDVHTSEPGLQFYSGQVVEYRGFCLEPQHYPDSPNRPAFPKTLLQPGERYESSTVYTFG